MQKLIKLLQGNFLLLGILALSAGLRLYGISWNPPSLNWDEVSHGYNAYSILKTGKDEWGESWPIIFRAYGDYKLPVYIYATSLSEALFGLTAFAVRLPSVISGIAIVLFTYLLTQKLWRDKRLALISALFVAIEPWSLLLSRVAFEANFSLALILSGVYFFPHPLSVLLLGLSVWTYNSARIFVPLLLAVLVLLHKKESLKPLFIILTSLFFIPMFWQLINPVGQARYSWVSILDQGAINKINESRNSSSLPQTLNILVNNKATFFATSFARNYLAHFSPRFLFFEGGSHYQQNIPGKGILYPVGLPFLLLGLIYIFVKATRGDKPSTLLLFWFLLGPVASSLTRDAPHVLRSAVLLPMPMIITALGLKVSMERLKRGAVWVLYLFALTFFFVSYFQNYFNDYRNNYSWVWQYGYKEAVSAVRSKYYSYDRIIMTKHYGEPHEFVLFYWPWDPAAYQSDPNLIRFPQSNWFWVDRFDKFYFVNDWEVKDFVLESGGSIPIQGKTLLVTSPGNYPPGWTLLQTLNYPDDRPVFDILEHEE